MAPQEIQISVDERDSVTALLYQASNPRRARITMILGHGAGANQLSPFMRLMGTGLSDRGIDVLTFNFVYMEQGRRVPDSRAKLENCFSAVIETAAKHKRLKGNLIVIGGKSMGGRIASQVAALERHEATPHPALAGLVFLGYPLHPPGKPEQLRDAHLPLVGAPMLFVQGSRDAFGSSEEIRAIIKKHHLPATLHVVEGGDHSLKVAKSADVTQAEVYEATLDAISSWLLKALR
jgi:predicted alpha/beta-hydrolase family hydrolase